jgi:hypothetical protein
MLRSRRHVIAAAAGSAVGAAVFFLALEWSLDDERWVISTMGGVVFGLFMAAWGGLMVRLDARQRTTRNVVFEHAVAVVAAVLVVAWAMALDPWPDLLVSTVLAVPFFVLLRVVTRRQIKGEDPDELFA